MPTIVKRHKWDKYHFHYNFDKAHKRWKRRSDKARLEINRRYRNKVDYLISFKGFEPF